MMKNYKPGYRDDDGFWNNATGTCNCGANIELTNDYLGACECPECGQWWNLFGQELKPVDEWRNGDDW